MSLNAAKDIKNALDKLKDALEDDLEACDMKWSLFLAAANSYKYDTVLIPFPVKYLCKDGISCDIERLMHVIADAPPIKLFLLHIQEDNFEALTDDVVDLLYWVLIVNKDPSLRSLYKEEFSYVLSKIPTTRATVDRLPNHIFEVNYSMAETKFKAYAERYPTSFAYYGNKLDSFYSILLKGRCQPMCKMVAHGDGIYLSSEDLISVSTSSASWGASEFGGFVSCLAVCEYIKSPRFVKHTDDHIINYLILRNNECVRIRYFLVYKNHLDRHTAEEKSRNVRSMLGNKMFQNIVVYAIFLVSIGVLNSTIGSYYRRLMAQHVWKCLENMLKSYF